MARILSDSQCNTIKRLNKMFEPYAKKGWMCEGTDLYGADNVIFNNDTEEIFYADRNGDILVKNCLPTTPYQELKEMAQIQGVIRKVCEQ